MRRIGRSGVRRSCGGRFEFRSLIICARGASCGTTAISLSGTPGPEFARLPTYANPLPQLPRSPHTPIRSTDEKRPIVRLPSGSHSDDSSRPPPASLVWRSPRPRLAPSISRSSILTSDSRTVYVRDRTDHRRIYNSLVSCQRANDAEDIPRVNGFDSKPIGCSLSERLRYALLMAGAIAETVATASLRFVIRDHSHSTHHASDPGPPGPLDLLVEARIRSRPRDTANHDVYIKQTKAEWDATDRYDVGAHDRPR